jgi:UDPglucose 6-dehydrogenase
MTIIQAVEDVNEQQKTIVFRKIKEALGEDLRGKRVALWGVAFKPETDDMRCAPALNVIDLLLQAGANITVYDPVAMDECRRRIGDKVTYAKDMYDAVVDADALALLTEWKQFRLPSWTVIERSMKGKTVIDGRNIYNPTDLADTQLELHAIGRK